MNEQQPAVLAPEQHDEMMLLRRAHYSHADQHQRAIELMRRGECLRQVFWQRYSYGTLDDMPYDDKMVANGEFEQRSLLASAKTNYYANLWRAREHKERYLVEYIATATKEARTAG